MPERSDVPSRHSYRVGRAVVFLVFCLQEDGMRIDRHFLVSAIGCLCLCVATAGLAHAQSFQGGLRGAVKDAQGVIPGVTVTLMNEANGVTRDTISNASGE